jgi:hypothetical protein
VDSRWIYKKYPRRRPTTWIHIASLNAFHLCWVVAAWLALYWLLHDQINQRSIFQHYKQAVALELPK